MCYLTAFKYLIYKHSGIITQHCNQNLILGSVPEIIFKQNSYSPAFFYWLEVQSANSLILPGAHSARRQCTKSKLYFPSVFSMCFFRQCTKSRMHFPSDFQCVFFIESNYASHTIVRFCLLLYQRITQCSLSKCNYYALPVIRRFCSSNPKGGY